MSEMGVALLAMAVEAFDGRNRIQYEIRGYQGLYNRLPMTPLNHTFVTSTSNVYHCQLLLLV